MAEMNFEKILQSFFNLNLNVKKNIFNKTKFLDEELEEEYIMETTVSFMKKKIYRDAFIIFCYLAVLLYIYVHKYEIMFVYVWLGCFAICLILVAFSHFKKSYSLNLFINHVVVFLLSIFLNFKVMYIAGKLNTPENDNDSEIIRTIIYDFVLKNILFCIALDTRVTVTIFLYLLNLFSVIFAQIKSNSNHYYYFDGATALIVTIFFYLLKKYLEANDRDNFAQKYRFEKFYYYTRDFIKGLNGLYMNISSDYSINCDKKMKTLITEVNADQIACTSRNIESNSDRRENREENKNDANSLISISNSVQEESYGKLSGNLLNLFTLYNEEDSGNRNLTSSEDKLGKNLKVLMSEASTPNFNCVGKYKLESSSFIKYYDVFFRKFSLNNKNSINDIIIYDITELITSKQKIVEEVKIKQKIMAKIVHEFKTPVNSIIGVIGNIEDSINAIRTDHDIKTTMKHLNTVRNLSNYVIFLISDIIHFSSIKSLEDMKVNLKEINLREITNFGFDILNSLLRCNKAKSEAIQPIFEFDEQIDSLLIKADDVRLKQIILNFVSNAVKFTKAGVIKLKCELPSCKDSVMLSISDTGVGIPDDEKEKLFQDFKMVKNDSINNEMGTGLGLSICKSLSSSMNMKIASSSILGQGSEFSLIIPIMPDPVIIINASIGIERDFEEDNQSNLKEIKIQNQSLGIQSRKSSSKTVKLGVNGYINPNINFLNFKFNENSSDQIPINSFRDNDDNNDNNIISLDLSRSLQLNVDTYPKRKEKILIVDDNHYINEATQNILKKVLTQAGSDIEIIVGSDGADIIHYLIQDQSNGNEIKCVLTDENMEYINGSEAIRMIRNLERRNKIKFINIISVTGNDESAYANEIIRAGAQLVLSKPLSKSVINRALKDLNII